MKVDHGPPRLTGRWGPLPQNILIAACEPPLHSNPDFVELSQAVHLRILLVPLSPIAHKLDHTLLRDRKVKHPAFFLMAPLATDFTSAPQAIS